ncbi:DUF6668 family protein [Streptomyces sp. NPDC002454]
MPVDPPGGPGIWVRGPVAVTETPAPAPMDPQQPRPAGRMAWVGAHGGAGVTTLAQVFGGVDAGRSLPLPAQGGPQTVVLVARTHASGLRAVSRVLDAFRRGQEPPGTTLAAVVLVADAPGRLPRPLQQRIKVIGSVVPVHRVPWVPAWRTGDLTVPPPRQTADLAALIAQPDRDHPRSGR